METADDGRQRKIIREIPVEVVTSGYYGSTQGDIMDYVTLGKAGVQVSRLCLGTMNFGDRTDEAESIRMIEHAIESGVNFIDTANIYSKGRSEQIVGKAIKGKRDEVVLATKVFGEMGDGPNDRGTSRYHIMQEVENSLKRLGTDRIDLYYLHRPDPNTPIEESLSTLTDLVRQGKVRYVGTSTFPAWELSEAQWVAKANGFEAPVAEQPPYSIFDRSIEREVLPFCKKYNIAVMPWAPIKGGWLSGRYSLDQPWPAGSRAVAHNWDTEAYYPLKIGLRIVEKLKPLAEARNVPLSQFALAWVLDNPVVTAPIIGPSTLVQLKDSLGVFDIQLTQEERDAIDQLVAPGSVIDDVRPPVVEM